MSEMNELHGIEETTDYSLEVFIIFSDIFMMLFIVTLMMTGKYDLRALDLEGSQPSFTSEVEVLQLYVGEGGALYQNVPEKTFDNQPLDDELLAEMVKDMETPLNVVLYAYHSTLLMADYFVARNRMLSFDVASVRYAPLGE